MASGLVDISPVTRGMIWSFALLWAGAACIANACRSGRLPRAGVPRRMAQRDSVRRESLHCYITGPFFLLLAAASLLYGLGGAPSGLHGWLWIAAVYVGGTPLLTFVPEWIWGRYSDRGKEHRC